MIKLISKQEPQPVAKTKPMYEMRPLEVCVAVDTHYGYSGKVVMRTASQTSFEVMDLTVPRPDSCWTGSPNLQVRELYPGETYTLELS